MVQTHGGLSFYMLLHHQHKMGQRFQKKTGEIIVNRGHQNCPIHVHCLKIRFPTKQNGSHPTKLPPWHFLKQMQQPTGYPAKHPPNHPPGNTGPPPSSTSTPHRRLEGQASFQCRPFCHQARRSSHWPFENSGTTDFFFSPGGWKGEVALIRNTKLPRKCHVFFGGGGCWYLYITLASILGTGKGNWITLDVLPWWDSQGSKGTKHVSPGDPGIPHSSLGPWTPLEKDTPPEV